MSRRGSKSYDISEWTLNNDFLTESEIITLRKQLKNYMFVKFKMVDEDIVQQTILRGMYKWEQWDSTKSNKITWFHTICRNYMKVELSPRFNKRALNVSIETPLAEGLKISDTLVSIEDDPIDTSYIDIIKNIIKRDEYDELRRYSEGESYSKISEVDGTNLSTVKSRIRHQRMMLKDHLISIGGADMEEVLTKRKRTAVRKNRGNNGQA